MSETTTRASADYELAYEADLIGNIRQVLAGLQGYETMALELLQNADDAGATRVRFDVRNDRLIIAHDSEFTACALQTKRCPWSTEGNPAGSYRPCDFHAVSRMAAAGKSREQGQIGRFGIGFVSVFQVCDTPTIRSAGVEMSLDPVTGASPIRFKATAPGTEVELVWARQRTETRRELQQSPVPNDICGLMEAALRKVTREGLLFLRRVREVEIARSGSLKTSIRIHRQPEASRVRVTSPEYDDDWFLLTTDAAEPAQELYRAYDELAELQRDTSVQIAFRCSDPLLSPGLLYAFLPTGQSARLPCHINADFFPRQDRRSIVTTGGGHQPAFNELLLGVAAAKIGQSIDVLKQELGPVATWDLFHAAGELEDAEAGFGAFWTELQAAAQRHDVGYTITEKWAPLASCVLPPADLVEGEEAAATAIGLSIIAHEIRPRRNILQRLGARQLNLGRLVDALEAVDLAAPADGAPSVDMPALWSLTNRLLQVEGGDRSALVKRLTAAKFVLNFEGDLTSIDRLYRPPSGVTLRELRRFLPSLPLLSEEASQHPALLALVDEIDLVVVASHLSEDLETPEAVAALLPNDSDLRDLLDLLGRFEAPAEEHDDIRAYLADMPLLPAGDERLAPARAQWPGGFNDPIGHFRLVDPSAIGERGEVFVREVLGVRTLTFAAYLEEHLDEILTPALPKAAYQRLLREVLRHEAELADAGRLQLLKAARLCRTTAGDFAPVEEVYERNADTEALFGKDGVWLDLAWLPAAHEGERVLGLFRRLGLGARVAARHLLARIDAITASPPTAAQRQALGAVVRHLLDRWDDLDSVQKHVLTPLRHKAWLPVTFNQAPDLTQWRRPDETQRPFNTDVFYSQLPFVDSPALRTSRASRSLLDFFEFPPEPPTDAIVDHLLWCAEEGIAPSENVYTTLQQRLERDGPDDLEPLLGERCIYFPNQGFRAADEVFWNPPPFRQYWSKAGSAHASRETLFKHLGVLDEPTPRHYAALLRRLVEENPEGLADRPHEALVHAGCLSRLAAELGGSDLEAREALDELHGLPFLLTLAGDFAEPAAVVWMDAPQLAEPFGADLRPLLVGSLQDRGATADLYRYLGVDPLSAVVDLVVAVAENPRPDDGASQLLRTRAECLAWLAPTPDAARRLLAALSHIQVLRVDALSQMAEFPDGEHAIVSAPVAVDAFYERKEGILYLRAEAGEVDWSSVFAALFPVLFGPSESSDLPGLVLSAALVASAPSVAAAERSLRRAGFLPLHLPDDEELGGEQDDDITGWTTGTEDPLSEPDADTQSPDTEEAAFAGQHEDDEPDEDDEEEEDQGRDDEEDGDEGHPERSAGSNSRAASSAGRGGLGSRSSTPNGDWLGARSGSSAGATPSHSPGASARTSGEGYEPRNSRIMTYVSHRATGGDNQGSGGDDRGRRIDAAAIAAVKAYEKKHHRDPEEQAHNHPGFDIVSADAAGARRLIEVKGLDNAWNDRGVKLTRTQFANAQRHGDTYWLYVVEHALDSEQQRVHAIRNPFQKVEEYWFDGGWRDVVEESASGRDAQVREGARVNHKTFGPGVVESVRVIAQATELVVNFRFEGRKPLRLSKDLEFLPDY